jgi:hypothetical protein
MFERKTYKASLAKDKPKLHLRAELHGRIVPLCMPSDSQLTTTPYSDKVTCTVCQFKEKLYGK